MAPSPIAIALSRRTTWLMLAIVGAVAVADLTVDAAYFGDVRLSLLSIAGAAAIVACCRVSLLAAQALLLAGIVAANTMLEDSTLFDLGVVNRQFPSFSELAACAILTICVVRMLPVVFAVIGAAAAAASFWLLSRRAGISPAELWAVLVVIGFGLSTAAGIYLRWLDTARELATQHARLDERTAIARELHDVVAHHVTGIVLQAQAAQMVLATRPEAVGDALAAIEQAGADAMRSMRSMVGSLRDGDTTAGFAPTASFEDLRALGMSRDGELPVELHLDPAVERLPGTLIASLHRIAQESVVNARRHARGATRVRVDIRADGSAAMVRAVDDGRPTLPSDRPGFGLIGVHERVEALGGRFRAGPSPDGGWQVLATFPLGGVS